MAARTISNSFTTRHLFWFVGSLVYTARVIGYLTNTCLLEGEVQ